MIGDRPLVAFEGVTVRFGPQPVLRGIDLDVKSGECVAVIGGSGCGKTVLLKLIVGLLRPTLGRVRFDGHVLAELPDAARVKQRLRIGFLFQQAALFDSLSVFENVAFGLRMHRQLGEAELAARVRGALAEVGLPEGTERKMPGELSGGMKKRVGLARALILEPPLMLYDEPTTGLDPIMTDVINQLIRRTQRRPGMTSLLVTHEMKTVRAVADRVVMLHPARQLKPGEPQVIYDGPPADLDKSPDDRVRRFVEGVADESDSY